MIRAAEKAITGGHVVTIDVDPSRNADGRYVIGLNGLELSTRPNAQAAVEAATWVALVAESAAELAATIATEPGEHTRDEDCAVDPDTDACGVCGVEHGPACPSCGARAFHRDGCPLNQG